MNKMILLFLIVFGILITASLVGYRLKLKYSTMHYSVIQNLNQRINAWWIMVLILAVTFALGPIGILCCLMTISLISLYEFLSLTIKGLKKNRVVVIASLLVLLVQYYLIYINWYGLYSIFIPVYVFLFLPLLVLMLKTSDSFLEHTAKIQWGITITAYCLSYIPALFWLNIDGYEGDTMLLIAFLIMVVQLSDVLQYIFGKLWGKHKIAPNLSPSKTVEGFFGGIISASLIGACLFWITPFNFIQAGMISLLITIMGFLGGLVMSGIKRSYGIKDWGNLIKGHGGMLDRVDSLCFSAPIFYHLIRFWWGAW